MRSILAWTLAAALAAAAGCSGPGDREAGEGTAATANEAVPMPPDHAAAPTPVADAAADAGEPAPAADPAPAAAARAADATAAAAAFVPPMARRPYRDDIPMAPMGTPKRTTIFDGKNLDRPAEDKEADSVQRGRRLVDPRDDIELDRGFESADALARAVLDRILWNEYDPLLDLRISKAEFLDLLWPEFPTSRPATNIRPDEAWSFHDADCRDGVTELLSEFGGQELHLVALRFETGFAPYTNFNLYRGAVIEAVDERGEPVVLRAATTFVERNGRWRIFTFTG